MQGSQDLQVTPQIFVNSMHTDFKSLTTQDYQLLYHGLVSPLCSSKHREI